MGSNVVGNGWAGIVQRRLEAINPAVNVTNVAENGAASKRALGIFPHVVPQVSAFSVDKSHPTIILLFFQLRILQLDTIWNAVSCGDPKTNCPVLLQHPFEQLASILKWPRRENPSR